MHVVREEPLAVELDDREQLPVLSLRHGVAPDVDLSHLDAELLPEQLELRARPFAQVAPVGVVERDDRHWRSSGAQDRIVNRTARTVARPPSVGYAINRSVYGPRGSDPPDGPRPVRPNA